MASKQTQTALCFLLLFASEFLVGIAVQAESSETVIGIDLGPVKRAMEDARTLKKSDVHENEIVLVGASMHEFFDGKDQPSKGVNPDEAVGAAIQGGVLSGESGQETEFVLFEVIPFSLGIETVGGVMTKVIPRNFINPIMRSQVFTTYQDQQTTVTIQVYKGERALTKDCRKLGSFELSGIAPAPRGVPRIEVTFIVDVNGILNVKAEDKATKKSESITITNELSVEEIEEMIRESRGVCRGG